MKAATFKVGYPATVGLFQSTPPVKAATNLRLLRFYDFFISIPAAREGGDLIRSVGIADIRDFNPRRP